MNQLSVSELRNSFRFCFTKGRVLEKWWGRGGEKMQKQNHARQKDKGRSSVKKKEKKGKVLHLQKKKSPAQTFLACGNVPKKSRDQSLRLIPRSRQWAWSLLGFCWCNCDMFTDFVFTISADGSCDGVICDSNAFCRNTSVYDQRQCWCNKGWRGNGTHCSGRLKQRLHQQLRHPINKNTP